MSQGFQHEFLSYVKRNSSVPSYPTTRGGRQVPEGVEIPLVRTRSRQAEERVSVQARGAKSLSLSEQLWDKVVLGVKEEADIPHDEAKEEKHVRGVNVESTGVVTRSGEHRVAVVSEVGEVKSGTRGVGGSNGSPGAEKVARQDSQPADSDDSSASPLPGGSSVESSRPASTSSSRPDSALGWSITTRKRHGLVGAASSEPTHAVRISASEGCTVSPRPVRPAGTHAGSRQKVAGVSAWKDSAVSGTSTGGFTPYGRVASGGRTTRARSGSGSSIGSTSSGPGTPVSIRRSSRRTDMKDPTLTADGDHRDHVQLAVHLGSQLHVSPSAGEERSRSKVSPIPAVKISERKSSRSQSPITSDEGERRVLRSLSVGHGAVRKSPSPVRASPVARQAKTEEPDSCPVTQTCFESPDSVSSGSSKTSPVVEPMLANRPKRNIIPKNLEFASGLSWREENDLKKALYASLQESRKLSRSTSVGSLEEKSQSVLGPMAPPAGREMLTQNGSRDGRNSRLSGPAVIDDSSQDSMRSVVSSSDNSQEKDFPFRTRIHAQRKFAQGSRPGSPTVTPVKPKPTPRKFFTTRRAKTEDFLTFLCLRGSHVLPPHLDFYNIEDSDENGHSQPTTPRHSQSGSRPGTPALGLPLKTSRVGASRGVSPTASKSNSPERELSLDHNDLGVRPLVHSDGSSFTSASRVAIATAVVGSSAAPSCVALHGRSPSSCPSAPPSFLPYPPFRLYAPLGQKESPPQPRQVPVNLAYPQPAHQKLTQYSGASPKRTVPLDTEFIPINLSKPSTLMEASADNTTCISVLPNVLSGGDSHSVDTTPVNSVCDIQTSLLMPFSVSTAHSYFMQSLKSTSPISVTANRTHSQVNVKSACDLCVSATMKDGSDNMTFPRDLDFCAYHTEMSEVKTASEDPDLELDFKPYLGDPELESMVWDSSSPSQSCMSPTLALEQAGLLAQQGELDPSLEVFEPELSDLDVDLGFEPRVSQGAHLMSALSAHLSWMVAPPASISPSQSAHTTEHQSPPGGRYGKGQLTLHPLPPTLMAPGMFLSQPRDEGSLAGSPVKKSSSGKVISKGPSLKPLSRSASTLLAKRKGAEKSVTTGTMFPVIPLKRIKHEQVRKAAQLVKKASVKVANKAKAKHAKSAEILKKSPKRKADNKARSESLVEGVSPKKKEKLESPKSDKSKEKEGEVHKKGTPQTKTISTPKSSSKKAAPPGGSELLLRSGARKQALMSSPNSPEIQPALAEPVINTTSEKSPLSVGNVPLRKHDSEKLSKKSLAMSGKGRGRPRKEKGDELEIKEGVLSDTDTDVSIGSRRSTRGRSPEKPGLVPLISNPIPDEIKKSPKTITKSSIVAISQKKLKAAKASGKKRLKSKESRDKSRLSRSSKSHKSKKKLLRLSNRDGESKPNLEKKSDSVKVKVKSKTTSVGKDLQVKSDSSHYPSPKAIKKVADVRVKDPSSSQQDKKSKNRSIGASTEQVTTHIPKTTFRAPFPSPEEPGRMAEVPTYHPSAEQFHDPIKYISSIRADAEQFGMCRIVPPDGWKPECQIKEDLRFVTQIQYIHRTMNRWGPNAIQLHCVRKFLENQGGITLEQSPMIGGVEIDLPALRETVAKFGGLQSVLDKKKLVKLADSLRVPQKVNERVNRLYDAYCKYLLAYETVPKEEQQRLERQVLQDIKKNPLQSVPCMAKGKSQTLSDFFRYSRHTMGVWFKDDPSPDQVEAEYWKVIREGRLHVAVQTANVDASICGSGFPTKKDSPYSRHGWNFNILRQDSDSLLKGIGAVSGVNYPTIHLNMVYSTSCWSCDRHLLPYMVYMHTVCEPNIWYCIPKTEGSKFHKVAKEISPSLVSDTPMWLRDDTLMIPPKTLVGKGISMCRTLHEPGQFLVVFPEAFTATVSCGYNLTESLHFATANWLPLGLKASEMLAGSCIKDQFSFAKLLLQLAHKEKLSADIQSSLLPVLKSLVKNEVALRRQLKEAGLKNWERLGGMVEVPDSTKKKKHNLVYMEVQEERCDISKQICYLSMVVNESDNQVYSLQQALASIPRKNLKKCKLLYRFKEKELRAIIEVIEVRVTGVASSQKSSKSATKTAKEVTS